MFRMLGLIIMVIIVVAYFFPSDDEKKSPTVKEDVVKEKKINSAGRLKLTEQIMTLVMWRHLSLKKSLFGYL